MSRSPRTTEDASSIHEYRSAWHATMQLLKAGHSFSGHERNCAFLNCQDHGFANASAITGLDFDDDGRAVGVTDWDGDGDLDVWLANRSGPRLRLMQNQTIGHDGKGPSFVAFRLQGTRSNRDAIGARIAITVTDSSAPQIQTLRAGDAYLSQSSKWVHFGLGDQTSITKVVVRWPSGASEQFTGISAGKRYRLIEGSGKASEFSVPRAAVAIKPSSPPPIHESLSYRTVLSNRLPAPLLHYVSIDGRETKVESAGRPRLILLWTSWCAACLAELDEITHRADSLRNARLDVLALTLDGLDQARSSDPAEALRWLKQLEFPFSSGIATREMLDKLELTESIVFNRSSGTTVPISYLLDEDGSLAAIYDGKLDISSLLEDVRRLNTTLHERRDLAVPLSGRWVNPPRTLLLRSVAKMFQDRGYSADSTRYLSLDAEVLQRQREQASSGNQRRRLDTQYAAANYNLGLELLSSGQPDEAFQYFAQAVAVRPNHLEALINLGVLMAKRRDLDQAIEVLERAVGVDPQSVVARTNLAAALSSRGDFERAIVEYRTLIEQPAAQPQLHSQLARALLETGRLSQAVDALDQALRENANDFPAAMSLAWLRATSTRAEIRDGALALRIAERLRTITEGKDPRVLDVLAAAHAEQGQFDLAQAFIERAMALLGPRNKGLMSAMQRRLEHYRAQTAFRDEDGKY